MDRKKACPQESAGTLVYVHFSNASMMHEWLIADICAASG